MPQKFSPHLQYQKTATISSSGLCCYAPTRGIFEYVFVFQLASIGECPYAYQLMFNYALSPKKTQALCLTATIDLRRLLFSIILLRQ